ncbi:MAG: TauD/TfdA family dioxygenase [Actinobacteria bacterium]|nr:TauD/TfdA family dioxygenase [Actinomycetota bacterium]
MTDVLHAHEPWTAPRPFRSGLRFGPQVAARTPADWVDRPYERFELRPLTPTIGAEVVGVDLVAMDDDTFAEVHRALLEWKVLFFRDAGLDPESHTALGARWGELESHPFLINRADLPTTVRFEKNEALTGYENVWHSDVSWRAVPSLGSLLRAVEVPPTGGDTLWADMAAAYDCLDPALQERLDGLEAVHDWIDTFGMLMDPEERERTRENFPPSVHPVVRTHPETGRKTLYVNAIFTTGIVGLDPEEGDQLLEHLCRQADHPEYQCRWKWSVGDLAIWDNRATQHYATSDYSPQRRVMERVTVIGDRPF